MSTPKLLVVDYEPRSMDKTLAELSNEPYEILTAKDGLDALEKFNAEQPDLILLRAMLPRKHGFQVCQEIKASPQGKNTPVIMHTSVYRGRKYKNDALKVYGADQYLEHPLDMDAVKGMLSTLSKGGRLPSQSTDTPMPQAPAKSPEAKPEQKQEPKKDTKPVAKKMVPAKEPEAQKTMVISQEDADPGKTLMLPPAPKPEKKAAEPKAPKKSVDQMLESTLAGISAPKKGSSKKAAANVDKMLESTLAGVAPPKKPAKPAPPAPKPKPEPAPEAKAEAKPEVKAEPEAEPAKAEKPEAKAPEAPAKKAEAPAPVQEAASAPDDSTVHSEDLFSEIIDEVESGKPEEAAPAAAAKPAEEPAPAKGASVLDDDLEKKLYKTLSGTKTKSKAKKKEKDAEELEKKLSDTLSGLKIKGVASVDSGKKEKPAAKSKEMKPDPEPVKEEGMPFGQYVLLDKIATGGMAEIFKAKQKGMEGFQKIVAIKRILPHMSSNEEFVTMFVDEAKVAAQLSHPNIAQIFDLGKAEEYHYIAMEYVDGEDLKKVLKASSDKKSQMPVKLAAYMASKVAAALHYAHTKKDFEGKDLNLVHRDVSPQNVMVSTDGDVKLVDFGIAKAESKIANTQAGALKGKLLYMSPEQAWGKDLDHRSDIFSLGAVLWELLTGERLFMGDSEMGILEKVRNADIQDIREIRKDVPEGLWTIMAKALEKDRDDRYTDANALHLDLDRFLYSEFRTLPTAFDLLSFFHELLPDAYTKERLKAIEQAVAEAPPQEPPPAPAPSPKAEEKPAEEEKAEEAPAPEAEKKEPPKKKITKKGRKGKLKKKALKAADAPSEDAAPAKEKKKKKKKKMTPAAPPAEKEKVAAVVQEDEYNSAADELVSKMEKRSPIPMIVGILAVAAVAVWWFFLRGDKPAEPAPANPEVVEKAPETTTPEPEAETTPEVAEPQKEPEKKTEKEPSKREESMKEALKVNKEFEDARKIASSSLMRAKKTVKAADTPEVNKFAPDQLAEAKYLVDKANGDYRRVTTPARMGKVAADADRANDLAQEAITTAAKRAKLDKDEAERLAAAEAKAAEPKPEPKAEAKPPEPEAPKIKPGQIVPLYELDSPPQPKKKPEPRLPAAARNRNITGKVTVKALIDTDGKVLDAKLVKGIQGDLGLNNACVDAIRGTTFNKPTAGGVPVKVWMSYTFRFK